MASDKAMKWTGWILTGLFVLFMIMDTAMKIVGMPIVDQTMSQLGWPTNLSRAIGVMELVIVLLYLYPRTAVFGGVLMTAVLGGAVATHLRIGSPWPTHILFGVYLGLFMWGGLYLRSPALRAVFPIRTTP